MAHHMVVLPVLVIAIRNKERAVERRKFLSLFGHSFKLDLRCNLAQGHFLAGEEIGRGTARYPGGNVLVEGFYNEVKRACQHGVTLTVRIIDWVLDLGNCPAVVVENFASQPSRFPEGGQAIAARIADTMPREALLRRCRS